MAERANKGDGRRGRAPGGGYRAALPGFLQAGGGYGGEKFFGPVPAVVIALAAIFAAIFIVQKIAPPGFEAMLGDRFGLSPMRLVAGLRGEGALGPRRLSETLAPLFTHAFIHASAPHLLFNLLWFFVFGTPVARRFDSPVRFIALFLCCSAAGALFFTLFHYRDPTLLVGASGGILGLLGALVRFGFHRPYSRPVSKKGVLPLTDNSLLTWAAVIIAMNASVAIFGSGAPGAGNADIAWQAHVGGFLFGLIAFPLFDPPQK